MQQLKVGGILANNKYRADFINDNLIIQNNIINACFKSGVKINTRFKLHISKKVYSQLKRNIF